MKNSTLKLSILAIFILILMGGIWGIENSRLKAASQEKKPIQTAEHNQNPDNTPQPQLPFDMNQEQQDSSESPSMPHRDQKQPFPQDNPSMSSSQTFRSDQLGILFDYPQNVSIQEESSSVRISSTSQGNTDAYWTIRIYNNSNNMSLENWISSNLDEGEGANRDCQIMQTNLQVGNYETIILGPSSQNRRCENAGVYVISTDKARIARFELGQNSPGAETIIPSFRFIQQ